MKNLHCIIGTVIIALTLSSCAGSRVVVRDRPTPPVEVRTVAPHNSWVWVSGDWQWRGGRYVYKNGYWAPPRRGYSWQPGHWEHVRHGWRWDNGRWRAI